MVDSGSGGGSPTANEGEEGCLERVRCLLGDKVDAMGCSGVNGECDGEHRREVLFVEMRGLFCMLRCDGKR